MFGPNHATPKSGQKTSSANRLPRALVLVLLLSLLMGCVSAGTPPTQAPLGKGSAAIPEPTQAATIQAGAGPAATATVAAPTAAAVQRSATPVVVAKANPAAGAFTPAPAAVNVSAAAPGFDPPVVGRGGTCIAGYTIDKYHAPRGGGWEVTVTPKDSTKGAPVTQKAGADGRFSFKDLKAGEYTIELKLPPEWRAFTPALLQVELDGVSANCSEVRFKIEALACLIVIKQDENGQNGLPGKVGIPGWSMTLTSDGKSLSGTTDGVGKAIFRNLAPGIWTIREEAKLGWVPKPGDSPTKLVDLESPPQPGACETISFINQQLHTSCITVTKADTKGNLLPDWPMTLVRKDGTRPNQTKNTNSRGQVTFLDLALGEWKIVEGDRDNYRSVGGTTKEVNLPLPATKCEEITFVNEPLACIDGYKINHLDQGLPGWTINFTHMTTGEKASAITGADGYFRKCGLSLGVWTVAEDLEKTPGWTAVTPSDFKVTLNFPFTTEHVRFKNRAPYACVDVYKRDAFDGVGLPDWPISLKPAYGDNSMIKTKQTSGDGWVRFDDLTPGEYIITESMLKGWVPVSSPSIKLTLEATGRCEIVTFLNRQEHMPANTLVPVVPPTATRAPVSNPQPGCSARYTVQAGDTIYRIALRYNVSQSRLIEVNKISNPSALRVGTVLCIP